MDNPWLMQGDCLERMKEIPNASVDLVFCDLPYGTTANKWDIVIPFEPLWEQYRRIAKDNSAFIFTASQPFTTDLICSNRNWFRYELIWDKTKGGGFANAKKQPMKSHENIAVFYKKQPTYNPQMVVRGKWRKKGGGLASENTGLTPRVSINNEYYPVSIITSSTASRIGKYHPTQKTEDLMGYLIATYSNPGDTVLDNAMGSGTTIVAAIDLNRRAIGIEKEEPIFRLAENRIRDHMNGVEPKFVRRKPKTGTMVPLLKGFE